jgi:hypothetical protein
MTLAAVLAAPATWWRSEEASDLAGALGGTRTPNLLIRSQMLYPLSYERRAEPSIVYGNRECGGGAPDGSSCRDQIR